MSDYIFRGKTISGAHAAGLLKSIQQVMIEAPNPTLVDIAALLDIVEDFNDEFDQSLRDHANELAQLAKDWGC